MVRLDLPFPVPLSACFKDVMIPIKGTGKFRPGRAPTGRYKTWQKEAMDMILARRPRKFSGQVAVYVRLVAPDRRARDAGNCDKAICDILVKSGVIADDSNRHVRRLTYEWADDGPPCVVVIQEVEPVQPPLFDEV